MDSALSRRSIEPTRARGPLFVVFNPRSGKQDGAEDLPAALRAVDRPHRLFTVDRTASLQGSIAAAITGACEERGIVAVAGGDGTINAVAQAALEADLPFGVIPRGTFNYFGRLHRLPAEADEALRVILGGRMRAVQVGRVNGRVFLVNASLGLYPKLLEDRERFKREYGRTRLVAFWAGLATLIREPRRMSLRLEIDTAPRALATSTLFVGNNPLQLDAVGIDEAEAAEQGMLVAVCVRPLSRLAMLGLALRGALGTLGDADQVENFAVRQLDVEPIGRGRAQVKVATDGETTWMRWPLRFEVSPRPLRLLVP
jgi:diacylglycerol kinase family enzyme